MPDLSFCLPYYRNPAMLAHQYSVWRDYDAAFKSRLEIVLVDDGSPEPAADVPRPAGLPLLRIFRVLEDRLWHQHGARNLAAHEAESRWLFLTDMDHVLPAASLRLLFDRLDRDAVYTFHRLDAPKLRPKMLRGNPHPHQNTYAVRRARYWAAGGYDEDFCGTYGTDGYFLRRLMSGASVIHLDDVPVVRYPREVIADASTRDPQGGDPTAYRDSCRRTSENQRRLSDKLAAGLPPTVLDFSWERVL